MKRWLGLLTVFFAAALVVFMVVQSRRTPETRFQAIEPGMSREAVIRLMGEPDHDETKTLLDPSDVRFLPAYYLVWNSSDGGDLLVFISPDGIVTGKERLGGKK